MCCQETPTNFSYAFDGSNTKPQALSPNPQAMRATENECAYTYVTSTSMVTVFSIPLQAPYGSAWPHLRDDCPSRHSITNVRLATTLISSTKLTFLPSKISSTSVLSDCRLRSHIVWADHHSRLTSDLEWLCFAHLRFACSKARVWAYLFAFGMGSAGKNLITVLGPIIVAQVARP